MKQLLVLMMAIGLLSACGVKPGEVEPPEEVKSGEFPRTYPDMQTDPPPFVAPTH